MCCSSHFGTQLTPPLGLVVYSDQTISECGCYFGFVISIVPHGLTEPRPNQYAPPIRDLARYHPTLGVGGARTLIGRCWRFLIRAMWCMIVAPPLAVLSLLLVFGMTCVICNRRIWPWEKSENAKYTDNMDSIHEGCCPQLARDLN